MLEMVLCQEKYKLNVDFFLTYSNRSSKRTFWNFIGIVCTFLITRNVLFYSQ